MNETELVARLEKLERDNRRLKKIGAAALVLAAALGLMAATRPVPDVIKAHEFDVVDASRKVRAKVYMDCSGGAETCSPSIRLFTRTGIPATQIYPGMMNLFAPTGGGSINVVAIKSGADIVLMSHGGRGGLLSFVTTSSGAASINVLDSKGFGTDLGSTNTVTPKTGAIQQTSAASIVMFSNDKKHRVIWQAP